MSPSWTSRPQSYNRGESTIVLEIRLNDAVQLRFAADAALAFARPAQLKPGTLADEGRVLLLEGWLWIEDDAAVALEDEFHRELSDAHPLKGVRVRAVARRTIRTTCSSQSEESARVYCVHLTWSAQSDSAWPRYKDYQDLGDFLSRWPHYGSGNLEPYTRQELQEAADGRWPERGDRCERCGVLVPQFADLSNVDRARDHRADPERSADPRAGAQGMHWCAGSIREIWAIHSGKGDPRYPGPPCPHCRAPLATSRAKQCLHCHRDWH